MNKFPLVFAGATAVLLLGLMHDSHATGGSVGLRGMQLASPDTQTPTEDLALRVTKLEAAMAQQQAAFQASIAKLQAQIDQRLTEDQTIQLASNSHKEIQALQTRFECHQHMLKPDDQFTGLNQQIADCKFYDGSSHFEPKKY